ncbi:hypothetical protein H6P81_003349 [Aristolochia fimbriata]|uniref:Uncharacterized protein n=1 Tax=Aristolochia fimbriata TaxID=158543 RepID=A0AAV7FDE2_ARIFI|nr:hypothetical protein H6P81_003349 [Aristolochia fimbriata]
MGKVQRAAQKMLNHGIPRWMQMEIFYNGITVSTRSLIDVATGETMNKKTPNEVYELIKEMASNMYQYPVERSGRGRVSAVHNVDHVLALQAQVESLTKQLTKLHTPSLVTQICDMCGGGHPNHECQAGNIQDVSSLDQANYVSNFCSSNDPYSNTYNLGWSSHPNFSWSNNNNQQSSSQQPNAQTRPPPSFQRATQEQEQKASLEDIFSKFLANQEKRDARTESRFKTQEASLKNQDASIQNLEIQLGQLGNVISGRNQGTLPSNSETNPKEQIKSITLRSGKVLEEKSNLREEDKENQQQDKEREEQDEGREVSRQHKQKGELKETNIILQFADRSTKKPNGLIEDVPFRIGKFIYPCNFVVLDMEVDWELPLILGRPFLATAAAQIDVKQVKLTLRLNDEEIVFDIKQAIKRPSNSCDDTCYFIDVIDECAENVQQEILMKDSLERCLAQSCTKEDDDPLMQQEVEQLEAEEIKEEEKGAEIKDPSKLELKPLPSSLKYVYLQDDSKPVIISSCLNAREEQLLIEVSDIKGISPTTCMHKILMEDSFKPTIQPQRRLNPTLQEVVKKEVVKLLDAGIIYPILDNKWVSPVQVVPKKGGMTVIKNSDNELIPTRTMTGWRVCID